jgi:excisionase family DNA binding protein
MISTFDTVSVTDAAQLIGVSPETLKRWSRSGHFAQPVTGGIDGLRWRFKRSDVVAYVNGWNDVRVLIDELIDALHAIAHDPDEPSTLRSCTNGRTV